MFRLFTETHSYDFDGEKLLAFSHLIDKYKNFDKEYFALYKALQYHCPTLKYYNIKHTSRSKEALLDIAYKEKIEEKILLETAKTIENHWHAYGKLSAESGTHFDLMSKQRSIRRKEEPCIVNGRYYPVIECNSLNPDYIRSTIPDYYNLKPGAYPDFMIYNLKHKVAGTLDWLYMNEDKTFIIKDLKRIKQYTTAGSTTMKHPLTDFKDSKASHCKLQLWFYAYLLECFGYKCEKVFILNYSSKGYKYYPYDYQAEPILRVLNHQAGLDVDHLPEIYFPNTD